MQLILGGGLLDSLPKKHVCLSVASERLGVIPLLDLFIGLIDFLEVLVCLTDFLIMLEEERNPH